ncbi:MbtH family protein [Solwaraspora sp. WMMB335]|uniref:MbtH family protein n=1 Tax=Solwaraspora sp. WMMB335 TaxID=3404118 RepID=UPI003B9319CD
MSGGDLWTVLVNEEEQFGLFPVSQPMPGGWRSAGFTGSEDECVAHVNERWTDQRPASLRRAMVAQGNA